jgi:hypothetical protein
VTRLAVALRREPVRLYLYGVLVAGEALAAAYGLVSANLGALWLGLGAAILVVPAAEAARAKVTPVDAPRTATGQPAELVAIQPSDDDLKPPPGGTWLG